MRKFLAFKDITSKQRDIHSINNCINNYFIVNMISTWSKTVCNDNKIQEIYSGLNSGLERLHWGTVIETETWWTRGYQLKQHRKALKQSTAYVDVPTQKRPECLPGGRRRLLWLKKNNWRGVVQDEPGEGGRSQIIHSLVDHSIFGFYPQSNEFNARNWHD